MPDRVKLSLQLHETSFDGVATITCVDAPNVYASEFLQLVSADGAAAVRDHPGGFAVEIEQGHTATISYRGTIREDLVGLYRPGREHNEQDAYVVTQLESQHASKVFPTAERYDHRLTIQLELECRSGWTVLTNGPESSTETRGSDRVVHHFEDSPALIADTFAVVAGKFSCFGAKSDGSGTEVSVWGQLERSPEAIAFALDCAVQSLNAMTAKFGPAGIAELKLVAVKDFGFGAMENPGCMVFRESALFYSHPGDSAEMNRVAETIAHEVSHLWFGHRLGIELPEEAWVKEGLASLYDGILAEGLLGRESDPFSELSGVDLAAKLDMSSADTAAAPATGEDAYSPVTYHKTSAILRSLRNVDPVAFDESMSGLFETHNLESVRRDVMEAAVYTDAARREFGNWGGVLHAKPDQANGADQRKWFVANLYDSVWWQAVLGTGSLRGLPVQLQNVGPIPPAWVRYRLFQIPLSLRGEWSEVVVDALGYDDDANGRAGLSAALLALEYQRMTGEETYAAKLAGWRSGLGKADQTRVEVAAGVNSTPLLEALLRGEDVDWLSSVLSHRPGDSSGLLAQVVKSSQLSTAQAVTVYRAFAAASNLSPDGLNLLLARLAAEVELGPSLQYQLIVALANIHEPELIDVVRSSGLLARCGGVPVMAAQLDDWYAYWLHVVAQSGASVKLDPQ